MYRQLLTQILQKISQSATAIATAVLLLTSLYGCGNKGDLYLPEDTATTYRNLTDTLQSEQ
jgi:predicted small lipoprotein YifL